MSSNNLKSTFNMTMWSASNIDLRNVDLVVEQFCKMPPEFDPSPYTFKKVENKRKNSGNTTCVTPPTWLLLDHVIAVIWSLFNQKATLHQLTIDDLKWAYEFLKEIKNKKGENPPDVKVCLKEIQDRLILLYARLTSLQDEDFDEIAAAFGEQIIADSTSDCGESKTELSTTSAGSSLGSLMQTQSSKEETKAANAKAKKSQLNYLMQTYPIAENDYESNIFDDQVDVPDEEIEKYILTLFDDEKKKDSLQVKSSVKSMIPTPKKTSTQAGTLRVNFEKESVGDAPSKEKTKKKVHCVAEMRSVKFQKSTKVQDNGEEAAYSNLKAEIRRLTINPNVSRDEIMKFLKDWRTEQVDKLHNELKRLNSIEEFMKNLDKDEGDLSLPSLSHLKLKEIKTMKTSFSRTEKFTT